MAHEILANRRERPMVGVSVRDQDAEHVADADRLEQAFFVQHAFFARIQHPHGMPVTDQVGVGAGTGEGAGVVLGQSLDVARES